MTGSTAHSYNPGLPEPPYSTELLADFHAGVLDPRTHDHVQQRLPADPHAAEVLAALDRVRSELRAEGAQQRAATTMPDHVAARLDSFIDDLTAE
ncbi:hypothetical protein [Gordonia hydrophobica]|uniref:Anti-sigma factor n=1 Tax=Gordonia hydrophobica TaxID=40516 RepID=A0ABZ2U5M1_9ACTN|nr:hypothetical protein [Gordonia hydrophobica]MBM7368735.1 hypothetical protein [Gordonia hydrophobica]